MSGQMIKMIWAEDSNRGIGFNARMPWHVPEDFVHFRRETMGSTVIMGRTSWDALPPSAKPLSGRKNIVITHHLDDEIASSIKLSGGFVSTFDDALGVAKNDNAYIIGGAKIYAAFMQYASELIITELDKAFEVDTFAPEIPDSFVVHSQGDWHKSKTGVNWRVVRYRLSKNAMNRDARQ
ncbi:MAG: dihydrofolate reductase [Candidatus Ancillula sp.]|nr:dihydrofolate reductase [Candidatus Ancillula sp.]